MVAAEHSVQVPFEIVGQVKVLPELEPPLELELEPDPPDLQDSGKHAEPLDA